MLRLALFNGYDAATSIKWLKKRKGYQKVDAATEVALKLWVEDWFLTKSDEEIEAIWDPESYSGLTLLASAEKAHREMVVCSWIAKENVQKGIAPGTQACMEVFDGYTTDRGMDEEASPSDRMNQSVIRNRTFAHRFRRRWGIHMSKMRERTIVQPEVLRQKAPASSANKNAPPERKTSPSGKKSGPFFGTEIRAPK